MDQTFRFTHRPISLTPAPADDAARFHAGTRISTPEGWRAIETLQMGDDVMAHGEGPVRITALRQVRKTRADWAYRREIWPVRVPVGSLGNPRPLRLAQSQKVVLSGDIVAETCGARDVSVPVGELVGLRGLILERPMGDIRYLGVVVSHPARIEAEGVLCEIEDVAEGPVDRSKIRAAFHAMHAVGEPALRAF